MSTNLSKQQPNRIIIYLALGVLLAGGLWLRLRFIHTVQLFPDEFVTLLAVRMIREKGLPIMPSGLFYDHGLLFSYVGSLVSFWGPARLTVRYASLFFGLLTIALTFLVGRRWFSPAVGLIAAAGLTVAPAAIHWSGRARMYALLQLLVLLTLWLACDGLIYDNARRRWLALLAYGGATLTHFAAVTLAPPLVLAGLIFWWPKKTRRHDETKRRKDGEAKTRRKLIIASSFRRLLPSSFPRLLPSSSPRLLVSSPLRLCAAFLLILVVAFLVKRAGQPKGIEVLEPGNVLTGLAQVLIIYGDFSPNLLDGWLAISSFYLTLPALIFTPFVLVATITILWQIGRLVLSEDSPQQNRRVEGLGGRQAGKQPAFSQPANLPILRLRSGQASQPPNLPVSQSPSLPISQSPNLPVSRSPSLLAFQPATFLAIVLLVTTLEMILVVSPDRRDDKYLFMLLPVLFLLGAQGMVLAGRWLLLIINYRLPITNYQLPILPLLISGLILIISRPSVGALLSNTGDDYDSAFAYVQSHWQPGDTILTGTPAAAAFYLGRNDFYSVQRRGGYDYRILTVAGQAVDRWLASPAIRTEAELHQILVDHSVWLVLERWGLQREYYDLPFQQQLLAQTDYVSQSQGIFILHSKPDPQPLALNPAQPVEAVFGDVIRLTGYTIEPERPGPGQTLRLTLYWQALAPMSHDYTVFVHLRPPGGGNVAQADHRPLGNLYPTTLWPVGEIIRERSELSLPLDLPPGNYEVWTGLYLLETGQRLPLQHDTSGENAVRLGQLEVD